MRIVLLGPPGAGKGTQAKRLVDEYNMRHLSSGDILRAEKASGSELGKQLAQYMDAGKLVPDDVVVGVMAKAISAPSQGAGLLLDGFPRTVPQADALDKQLAKLGAPLDLVMVIDAAEDLIVKRITGRRSCPKCGEVYHVHFMPPKSDNVCDKDGTKLIQRDDDKEEVIRKRLETYHRQTAPLVEYYRNKNADRVLYYDGNQSAEQVCQQMVKDLNRLQA